MEQWLQGINCTCFVFTEFNFEVEQSSFLYWDRQLPESSGAIVRHIINTEWLGIYNFCSCLTLLDSKALCLELSKILTFNHHSLCWTSIAEAPQKYHLCTVRIVLRRRVARQEVSAPPVLPVAIPFSAVNCSRFPTLNTKSMLLVVNPIPPAPKEKS